MSDDFTLIPLFLNNNQFVYFAVGGLVGIMGLVFVLTFMYSHGKNKVQVIKNPNTNGFTLQRYLLAFKTSPLPDSGLPIRVAVRVSITGQKGSTPYVSLTRPLYPNDTLTRGKEDVYLLHFENGVGDINQVHLYTENTDLQNVKWLLDEVNVYDPQTQRSWKFPVADVLSISSQRRQQRFQIDGSANISGNTRRYILDRLLSLHSLLTIFGKPQEIGVMVMLLKVGLLTTTVSLLYVANLLVYILSHMFSTSIPMTTLLGYSVIGHLGVWTISFVCELLARNIRPKWSFCEKKVDSSNVTSSAYPQCSCCDKAKDPTEFHIPGCLEYTGQYKETTPLSPVTEQLTHPAAKHVTGPAVLQVGFVTSRHSLGKWTKQEGNLWETEEGGPSYMRQGMPEISEDDTKAVNQAHLDDPLFRSMEQDLGLLKKFKKGTDTFHKLCQEVEQFDTTLLAFKDQLVTPSVSREYCTEARMKSGEQTLQNEIDKGVSSEVKEMISGFDQDGFKDLEVLRGITDPRNTKRLETLLKDINDIDKTLKDGHANQAVELTEVKAAKITDIGKTKKTTKSPKKGKARQATFTKSRRKSSVRNGKTEKDHAHQCDKSEEVADGRDGSSLRQVASILSTATYTVGDDHHEQTELTASEVEDIGERLASERQPRTSRKEKYRADSIKAAFDEWKSKTDKGTKKLKNTPQKIGHDGIKAAFDEWKSKTDKGTKKLKNTSQKIGHDGIKAAFDEWKSKTDKGTKKVKNTSQKGRVSNARKSDMPDYLRDTDGSKEREYRETKETNYMDRISDSSSDLKFSGKIGRDSIKAAFDEWKANTDKGTKRRKTFLKKAKPSVVDSHKRKTTGPDENYLTSGISDESESGPDIGGKGGKAKTKLKRKKMLHSKERKKNQELEDSFSDELEDIRNVKKLGFRQQRVGERKTYKRKLQPKRKDIMGSGGGKRNLEVELIDGSSKEVNGQQIVSDDLNEATDFQMEEDNRPGDVSTELAEELTDKEAQIVKIPKTSPSISRQSTKYFLADEFLYDIDNIFTDIRKKSREYKFRKGAKQFSGRKLPKSKAKTKVTIAEKTDRNKHEGRYHAKVDHPEEEQISESETGLEHYLADTEKKITRESPRDSRTNRFSHPVSGPSTAGYFPADEIFGNIDSTSDALPGVSDNEFAGTSYKTQANQRLQKEKPYSDSRGTPNPLQQHGTNEKNLSLIKVSPPVRRKSTKYFLVGNCDEFDDDFFDEFEALCENEARKAAKRRNARKQWRKRAHKKSHKSPKLQRVRRVQAIKDHTDGKQSSEDSTEEENDDSLAYIDEPSGSDADGPRGVSNTRSCEHNTDVIDGLKGYAERNERKTSSHPKRGKPTPSTRLKNWKAVQKLVEDKKERGKKGDVESKDSTVEEGTANSDGRRPTGINNDNENVLDKYSETRSTKPTKEYWDKKTQNSELGRIYLKHKGWKTVREIIKRKNWRKSRNNDTEKTNGDDDEELLSKTHKRKRWKKIREMMKGRRRQLGQGSKLVRMTTDQSKRVGGSSRACEHNLKFNVNPRKDGNLFDDCQDSTESTSEKEQSRFNDNKQSERLGPERIHTMQVLSNDDVSPKYILDESLKEDIQENDKERTCDSSPRKNSRTVVRKSTVYMLAPGIRELFYELKQNEESTQAKEERYSKRSAKTSISKGRKERTCEENDSSLSEPDEGTKIDFNSDTDAVDANTDVLAMAGRPSCRSMLAQNSTFDSTFEIGVYSGNQENTVTKHVKGGNNVMKVKRRYKMLGNQKVKTTDQQCDPTDEHSSEDVMVSKCYLKEPKDKKTSRTPTTKRSSGTRYMLVPEYEDNDKSLFDECDINATRKIPQRAKTKRSSGTRYMLVPEYEDSDKNFVDECDINATRKTPQRAHNPKVRMKAEKLDFKARWTHAGKDVLSDKYIPKDMNLALENSNDDNRCIETTETGINSEDFDIGQTNSSVNLTKDIPTSDRDNINDSLQDNFKTDRKRVKKIGKHKGKVKRPGRDFKSRWRKLAKDVLSDKYTPDDGIAALGASTCPDGLDAAPEVDKDNRRAIVKKGKKPKFQSDGVDVKPMVDKHHKRAIIKKGKKTKLESEDVTVGRSPQSGILLGKPGARGPADDLDVLISVTKKQTKAVKEIIADIHEFDTSLKLSGVGNTDAIKKLMTLSSDGKSKFTDVSDPEGKPDKSACARGKRAATEVEHGAFTSESDGVDSGVDISTFKPRVGRQSVLDLMKLIIDGKKDPVLLQSVLRDFQALDDVLQMSGAAESPVVQNMMKDNFQRQTEDSDFGEHKNRSVNKIENMIDGKSHDISVSMKPSFTDEERDGRLAPLSSRQDFNVINNILGPNASIESLNSVLQDIREFDSLLDRSHFKTRDKNDGSRQMSTKLRTNDASKGFVPQGSCEGNNLTTTDGLTGRDLPELPRKEKTLIHDDSESALRMLKSIVTDRSKDPFKRMVQDVSHFDNLLHRSGAGNTQGAQDLLLSSRNFLKLREQDDKDYDLVRNYSSQEWNETKPKSPNRHKEKKKCTAKTDTSPKIGTNSKALKSSKIEQKHKVPGDTVADKIVSDVDDKRGASRGPFKIQPEGSNETMNGSVASESLALIDKRDILFTKILKELHSFHQLVSSLNDIDYNILDRLIEFLLIEEKKPTAELYVEVIGILDKSQGLSENKQLSAGSLHHVSDTVLLQAPVPDESPEDVHRSTSSVQVMDKSGENEASRQYQSDQLPSSLPRQTRNRTAQKSSAGRGRYPKKGQKQEKIPQARKETYHHPEISGVEISDHKAPEVTLSHKGTTEDGSDSEAKLHENRLKNLLTEHDLPKKSPESIVGLKIASDDTLTHPMPAYSALVEPESQTSVATLVPATPFGPVCTIEPEQHTPLTDKYQPRVCNCIINILAKALVEKAVRYATMELITDLDSLINVFHKYMSTSTTISLLKKWRIPAHTELLTEVLDEVFWHLEQQGYGRMRHPADYLAQALLLQRVSQTTKNRYTLALWPDSPVDESHTLKLGDIIHLEKSLSAALHTKMKSCLKADLRLCLKNVKDHVEYSLSLKHPTTYLSSLFFFYIDFLTEKTTPIAKEVFDEVLVKDWSFLKTPLLPAPGYTDTILDRNKFSSDSQRTLQAPVETADGSRDGKIKKIPKAEDVEDPKRVTFSKPVEPAYHTQGLTRSGELNSDRQGKGDGVDSLTTDFRLLNRYVEYVIHDERKRQEYEVSDYCLSKKGKLENFLVENLQKVIDFQRTQGKEPTLSDHLLKGLQYEVCGYSKLALPWAVYPCLVVFLCMIAVGSLLYTVLKGQDLTPDESSEWIACVLVGVLTEMFIFQPLKILLWEACKSVCVKKDQPRAASPA